MRRRDALFRVGLVLLVGLSVSCAGCFRHCCFRRARHGLVFRGNFALELNRVPWVHSRTEVCDERSELDAQLETLGCRTYSQPIEAAGPPVDAGACQAAPGEVPCGTCVGPVRAALLGLRTLGGRLGGSHGPAVPTGPEGISRFHPVPTQPAFSRRDWQLGPAPAVPWTAGSQADLPWPPGEQMAPSGPLPAAPAPEELQSLPPEPAPAPAPAQGQQARAPSDPSAVRSWIFMAPEPRHVDAVAGVRPRRTPQIASR